MHARHAQRAARRRRLHAVRGGHPKRGSQRHVMRPVPCWRLLRERWRGQPAANLHTMRCGNVQSADGRVRCECLHRLPHGHAQPDPGLKRGKHLPRLPPWQLCRYSGQRDVHALRCWHVHARLGPDRVHALHARLLLYRGRRDARTVSGWHVLECLWRLEQDGLHAGPAHVLGAARQQAARAVPHVGILLPRRRLRHGPWRLTADSRARWRIDDHGDGRRRAAGDHARRFVRGL